MAAIMINHEEIFIWQFPQTWPLCDTGDVCVLLSYGDNFVDSSPAHSDPGPEERCKTCQHFQEVRQRFSIG